MKKKTKFLVPLISLALVQAGAIGVSIAYFTASANVTATVHMASVEIAAEVDADSFQYSSLGVAQTGGFELGGVATVDSSGNINVTQMAPGDKLTFDVTLKNTSTIAINYKATLAATVGSGTDYSSYFTLAGDAEGSLATTDTEKTVTMSIELPAEVEEASLMDQEVTFTITFEAIQGNASLDA